MSALHRIPPTLERVLPLVDPEAFDELAFFRELEGLGCRQVLLGGTGSAKLRELVPQIRAHTSLRVVLYPSGPDAVCAADLIVLPEIMNSTAPHARPFGPAAVMTAAAVAKTGSPWLPVAHFIQGDSTARWYYGAEPLRDTLLVAHCGYAAMIGYRDIALDYEDPRVHVEPELIAAIKRAAPSCRLTISDDVEPEAAQNLFEHGLDTLIVPSNVLENASAPLQLLRRYLAKDQPPKPLQNVPTPSVGPSSLHEPSRVRWMSSAEISPSSP
ncbi:MAG TPA: hypothetical protein VG755_14690 [Nannocystaceae bacterium]|nr:hypothetical protein [Nannocystaceae bacterium]